MKTITSLSFLATLAIALLAPISIELAGSLLLATGMAAILTADYKRRVRLPIYGQKPALAVAKGSTPAALRLAA